jgi:hypothetical protein
MPTASMCGEVSKDASLTGEAAFIVEFPGEATITTISFGLSELVGSATKASTFRLSVGVINAQGGRPSQRSSRERAA